MTIYAVCEECAHIEPRPDHAREDWRPCEFCGNGDPVLAHDLEAAEELSESILSDA